MIECHCPIKIKIVVKNLYECDILFANTYYSNHELFKISAGINVVCYLLHAYYWQLWGLCAIGNRRVLLVFEFLHIYGAS